MAIRSMTGFGRGVAEADGFSAVVELSTINRKQFENCVLVPRELAVLESRVDATLRGAIRRGLVKGSIAVSTASAGAASIDMDLAAAQVSALRDAATKLGLADDLSASVLLSLPDAITLKPRIDAEKAWPVIGRALSAALDSLSAMRLREGAVLAADLNGRLDALSGIRDEIARRAPTAPEMYRDKLEERIAKLSRGMTLDQETLAREVALFADRTDVSEELTRLGSHLDQARALLSSDEPAGRTLDFLCQEMLREINTTGSKSADAGITDAVISFKSLLETFREQVQNIE